MFDLTGEMPHHQKSHNIGDGPVPDSKFRQVAKSGVNDLIHQAGIDSQDGNKHTEQQERISHLLCGSSSYRLILLVFNANFDGPSEEYSQKKAQHDQR